MVKFYQLNLALIACLGITSCGGGDSSSTDLGTDIDEESSVDVESVDTYTLDTSLFRSINSSNTVSCTLNNGSTTTCYELKFAVNTIEDGTTGAAYNDEGGPYCPPDRATIGGLGSYDGDDGVTNVIHVMNAALWTEMEGDGYDLFFGAGDNSICTSDLFAGTSVGPGGACSARCLENSTDDTLVATFLIPVTPELLTSNDDIGVIEHIGVTLDGIPFTGTPPSVTGNGGNIPALDHCGGHVDPSGYYHAHFITEAMDTAIVDFGISLADASCSITQDDDALFGYAKDGYPIYSTKDSDGTTPTDLDECNGHTGQTNEFSAETYHYHAVTQTNAPNFPLCLKGASVDKASTPIIM